MRLKKLRLSVATALSAACVTVVVIFTKGLLQRFANLEATETTQQSNTTNTNTTTNVNTNTNTATRTYTNTNTSTRTITNTNTNRSTNTPTIVHPQMRTRAS